MQMRRTNIFATQRLLPKSSSAVVLRKGGQIQAQDGIGFEFKEVRDRLVQKQKRFGEKQSQGSVNPADVLKQAPRIHKNHNITY